MFVLFTLENSETCAKEEVVYELSDDSTKEYIGSVGLELIEDKNSSEGIEVGEDNGSGVELEGYSYIYEILECTREEVEENYGEIMQL